MSTQQTQIRPPVLDPVGLEEIAEGVWVIPDREHTLFVPNVGIAVGSRATLVIDTGLGSENARTVIDQAKRLSSGNPIYLTHTHFHPEHGFGANVIAEEVTVAYNETQWTELQEKGAVTLRMFREMLPTLAPMLADVEFLPPQIRYEGSLKFDLGGGLIVELHEVGGAHSRGDQAIVVRCSSTILFAGDLIEQGYFGMLADNESGVLPWIERLARFERLEPDIVVPGHGFIEGPGLIAEYREYFELARRRVAELRGEDVPEAEIPERVGAELIELHPDWRNQPWATKTVTDLTWPTRP